MFIVQNTLVISNEKKTVFFEIIFILAKKKIQHKSSFLESFCHQSNL